MVSSVDDHLVNLWAIIDAHKREEPDFKVCLPIAICYSRESHESGLMAHYLQQKHCGPCATPVIGLSFQYFVQSTVQNTLER